VLRRGCARGRARAARRAGAAAVERRDAGGERLGQQLRAVRVRVRLRVRVRVRVRARARVRVRARARARARARVRASVRARVSLRADVVHVRVDAAGGDDHLLASDGLRGHSRYHAWLGLG